MQKFRIFVSSPGDVKKERNLLNKVVEEINLTNGSILNYHLELWKYEEQAYPSASKPQVHINSILPEYQIFLGIMWKRFGTPTDTAGSGTEEEYIAAFNQWQKYNSPDIMFYFSRKPFSPNSTDEIEQMGKVLQFKKTMMGKSLIWDYNNPNDFEDTIRKHLCLLMNKKIEEMKNKPVVPTPPQEKSSVGSTAFPPAAPPSADITRGPIAGAIPVVTKPVMAPPKAAPDEESINALKAVWNSMSPDLQSFMSISYNENRMKGDGGIKTKDLFAAMITNPTPEISAIVKHIPEAALPEPISGKLIDEPYIANEKPWLSHCISSSIKRLGKVLQSGQQLTSLDVFIDIARNGTGESVRLLREHKVTPTEIDRILQAENIHALEA